MHVGLSLLTLLPERVGGSETYVRALLREFARGNGPERVTVLANSQAAGAYRDFAGGPVELREVSAYRQGDTTLARAAAMARAALFPVSIRRELPSDMDVLHFPLTIPLPRATGLPTVLTLHDLQHRDLPVMFRRSERAFRRLAYDGAARRAGLVVTPSEFSRNRAIELLALDPAAVVAVRSGIDHSRFRPASSEGDRERLAALGLPDVFVLYPANLWPHKNHERLFQALASTPPEVCLVLTGETYGRREQLLARARALGVGDRVRHLGLVGGDAMPALIRSARAMVFPSLYEGFGAPPLEAMACGCPVAASAAASLAEVCGDAALELDPENPESIAHAIERIVSDGELRTRLRERGLEQAARFSWSAAAAGHVRAYEHAATGRTVR